MSENINLERARQWFEELWSRPDYLLADAIIAPDYAPDWIQIPKTGPEQVKHEIHYFRSIFPDLRYEIVDTATHGQKVWVRYKGVGTHLGEAWGFEPTGKKAVFEGVTIFTINGQLQISDRWGAFCFYDLFAGLGLTPPFWELSQNLKRSLL